MLRSGSAVMEDDEELLLLPQGNLSRRPPTCDQLCRRFFARTLCCGLLSTAVVALLYVGNEMRLQRTKLERLQRQLARGASTPGPDAPCIDRWEVQYPAELDIWNGHSCMWKKTWGQCDKFARQCRRTCELCETPASEDDDDEDKDGADEEDEGEGEEEETDPSTDAEQEADTAAAQVQASSTVTTKPGPKIAGAATAPPGEDSESLLQALRAREASVRLGLPGSTSTTSKTNQGAAKASSEDGESESANDDDGDTDDDTSDEGGVSEGDDGTSYGQAPSTNAGATAPPGSNAAEVGVDRQRYVAGDSTTVVSAGSECGVPTPAPASSKGLEMGVLATKNFAADSRSYSSVTYLSSTIRMQPGEVHHYQHSVQLPRPAEKTLGIQSYVMEILEQTGSELRPAPESAIHLKRFALQQQTQPGGGQSCATESVLFVGEGSRGVEVAFPHPFVLQPGGEDAWQAQLHLVRTDGLSIPLAHARQCICMRASIGSTSCCPHGCLYPVAAKSPPLQAAQYRLSVVVTWLLASSEPAASPARPLRTLWLPSGPAPREPPVAAAEDVARVACLGQWSLLSEFDLPACTSKQSCSRSSAGAWRMLTQSAPLIVALGVGNDRMTRTSLWARGGDHGAAHAIGSACGMDHTARRTVPCVFPGGEVLPRGSQLQVRAEWNTSHAVLGADVGFMLWVTES